MRRLVHSGFTLFTVLSVVSLLVAAAPATAAPPRCLGRAATIVGTNGNDTLRGTNGADVIVGLRGRDRILGRGGNDRICAGAGAQSFDEETGERFREFSSGGGGADRIAGGRGPDHVVGGPGDDRLNSGPGSFESLEGNAGNDALDGGPGFAEDARFLTSQGPVVASLADGAATGEGTDRFRNLDELMGSSHDDTLTGDLGDPEAFAGLYGHAGDDTLIGGAESNFLWGGPGDDDIDGGDGFDFLDHVHLNRLVGLPSDAVTVNLVTGTVAGQGTDTIRNVEGADGTPGDDSFIGNDEANEFTQMFEGDDTVDAGAGDDLVDGGDGTDDLDGGEGQDLLGHLDHSVAVTVDLQARTSTGTETDQIDNFEDVLGSFENDEISGDSSANVLMGAPGDDTLMGLAGDDTLIGEGFGFHHDEDDGTDSADGGPGTDACDAETEVACEGDPPPEQALARRVPAVTAWEGTKPSALLMYWSRPR
ncbi:MAG: hypothetical protein M3277_02195 [Actinomycetota bacterium]|nr:hypothetical protein [Actinomycetota bacterium]